MNKDELIETLVKSQMAFLGTGAIAFDEIQTILIKQNVLERVNEWQQDLINEIFILISKIPTDRPDYITGLRDAIDIINGAGGMDPLPEGFE